jgi:hypothetical protein
VDLDFKSLVLRILLLLLAAVLLLGAPAGAAHIEAAEVASVEADEDESVRVIVADDALAPRRGHPIAVLAELRPPTPFATPLFRPPRNTFG